MFIHFWDVELHYQKWTPRSMQHHRNQIQRELEDWLKSSQRSQEGWIWIPQPFEPTWWLKPINFHSSCFSSANPCSFVPHSHKFLITTWALTGFYFLMTQTPAAVILVTNPLEKLGRRTFDHHILPFGVLGQRTALLVFLNILIKTTLWNFNNVRTVQIVQGLRHMLCM